MASAEKLKEELAALERLNDVEAKIEEALARHEGLEVVKRVDRVGKYGSAWGLLRFYVEHSKEMPNGATSANNERVSPRQSRSTELVWGLHLEARLCEASDDFVDLKRYAMSEFIEKIQVFWDRTKSGSGNKKEYGYAASLTWVPPGSLSTSSSAQTTFPSPTSQSATTTYRNVNTSNKVDGLSITRLTASRSSKSIQTRFAIYRKFSPPKYKLSNTALSKVIEIPKNTDCLSREAIIQAITFYIDENHLHDGRDGRLIHCDTLLATALQVQNFQFQQLETILTPFLLPPDPILLDYTIPSGDLPVQRGVGTSTKSLDLFVDIPLHDHPEAQLTKPLAEIYDTKTNIAATLETMCYHRTFPLNPEHEMNGSHTNTLKKRSFTHAFAHHSERRGVPPENTTTLRHALSEHIEHGDISKIQYLKSSLPPPSSAQSTVHASPLTNTKKPQPPLPAPQTQQLQLRPGVQIPPPLPPAAAPQIPPRPLIAAANTSRPLPPGKNSAPPPSASHQRPQTTAPTPQQRPPASQPQALAQNNQPPLVPQQPQPRPAAQPIIPQAPVLQNPPSIQKPLSAPPRQPSPNTVHRHPPQPPGPRPPIQKQEVQTTPSYHRPPVPSHQNPAPRPPAPNQQPAPTLLQRATMFQAHMNAQRPTLKSPQHPPVPKNTVEPPPVQRPVQVAQQYAQPAITPSTMNHQHSAAVAVPSTAPPPIVEPPQQEASKTSEEPPQQQQQPQQQL